MTILQKIIESKYAEVDIRKQKMSSKSLQESEFFERKVLSMTEFVSNVNKTGIIAEFKRKSPSRGIINMDVTIEEVTTGYFRSGASALSVLTDSHFFGGTDNDLLRARELNPIPILRKEFIIDEYQVIESKALGADAVLMIAAVLKAKRIKALCSLAHSIGLQVLLELHDESEMDAINEHVDMIGINNRDLKTFTVDIERSFRMIERIPEEFCRISESGISSPMVIRKLRRAGFQGFLIGENFMRSPDPVSAFSSFIKLIV